MFEDIVVNKPWGYEYQIYEDDNVSIWCLNINYNQITSLHSHPHKKTGLIILAGVAEVSFLNDRRTLTPPDKTMIRHGVFHSIRAKSKQEAIVLEIEHPKDKYDLVRLEDYYGRAGTKYENSSFYKKKKFKTLNNNYEIALGDCVLKKEEDLYIDKFHTFILLGGGVKYKNYPVLSYGDIVDQSTLKRLSDKFDLYSSKNIGLKY